MIKKYILSGFFGVVFVVFFIVGYSWLDPDFGWHLRIGEIIYTSGIPSSDPFSYTMPGYPFVDYEWLSNYLTYLMFSKLGYVGVTVVYSIVVILGLWLIKLSKSKYWHVPVILIASLWLSRFGVRPQVMSWIFVALFYWIMETPEKWKRWRITVPLIVFLWTNLHGSYPTGGVVLAIYYFFELVIRKRMKRIDVIVGVMSFAAIFVNPYGQRNILEVLMQMSQSGFFRQTVSEWFPFYYFNDPSFWAMFALSFIFLAKMHKQVEVWKMVLYVFFLVSGLYSARHLPFFMVIGGFVLIETWQKFLVTYGNKEVERRFDVFYLLLVVISVFVFVYTLLLTEKNVLLLNEGKFYPRDAVEFLKRENFEGELFADYGWGGYLIWKMPERRYFVDGRMSGFSWEAPRGQSNHAFKEYLAIVCGKQDYKDTFEKYRVGLILWPKFGSMDDTEIFGFLKSGFIGKIRNILEVSYCRRESGSFLDDILNDNEWLKVYEDDNAYIFRKR